jgi:hypothetical protein
MSTNKSKRVRRPVVGDSEEKTEKGIEESKGNGVESKSGNLTSSSLESLRRDALEVDIINDNRREQATRRRLREEDSRRGVGAGLGVPAGIFSRERDADTRRRTREEDDIREEQADIRDAGTVVPSGVVMSQQSINQENAAKRQRLAERIIEREEAVKIASEIDLEDCPKTNIPTKTLNAMLTVIKFILTYGLMTAPEALADIRSFVYQYWYKVKNNLIDAESRSLLNEIYMLLGGGVRPLSIAYACKQPMSKWISMIKEFGEKVFSTYELGVEKNRLLNEQLTPPGPMEISRLEDEADEERREAIHALLSLQDEDGDSFTEDDDGTLTGGGKHHTRKHKKQNKSRKQMKHKKTKRHRKKTKKHLKKRNNKKQRKTRNRK